MSTMRMMLPTYGIGMKLSRYIHPLWLMSCSLRMVSESDGTKSARPISPVTPNMMVMASVMPASDPPLAPAMAKTTTMRSVMTTLMRMNMASSTHQYSLRDARPEKFFQFLSHSLTAWTIDTDGRGLVSYTAVYGARPPAYCCP